MGGLLSARRAFLTGAGAASLSLGAYKAFGSPPDVLKLIMEFRIYGGNSPMFLAQQSIFPKFNLDVTPIGSAGSGEAVRNLAAGVYKFGVADASTVIAFA